MTGVSGFIFWPALAGVFVLSFPVAAIGLCIPDLFTVLAILNSLLWGWLLRHYFLEIQPLGRP